MRRTVPLLVSAVLAAWSGPSAAAVCDIGVDRAYKLFVVSVDGEAFKGKRYLTYDDAARLRDVLVMSGECVMPAKVSDCKPGKDGKPEVDFRLASVAGAEPAPRSGATAGGSGKGFKACTYQ